jgi:hypothetical protein
MLLAGVLCRYSFKVAVLILFYNLFNRAGNGPVCSYPAFIEFLKKDLSFIILVVKIFI